MKEIDRLKAEIKRLKDKYEPEKDDIVRGSNGSVYGRCPGKMVVGDVARLESTAVKMAEYIYELVGACPCDQFEWDNDCAEQDCRPALAMICWQEYFESRVNMVKGEE